MGQRTIALDYCRFGGAWRIESTQIRAVKERPRAFVLSKVNIFPVHTFPDAVEKESTRADDTCPSDRLRKNRTTTTEMDGRRPDEDSIQHDYRDN